MVKYSESDITKAVYFFEPLFERFKILHEGYKDLISRGSKNNILLKLHLVNRQNLERLYSNVQTHLSEDLKAEVQKYWQQNFPESGLGVIPPLMYLIAYVGTLVSATYLTWRQQQLEFIEQEREKEKQEYAKVYGPEEAEKVYGPGEAGKPLIQKLFGVTPEVIFLGAGLLLLSPHILRWLTKGWRV